MRTFDVITGITREPKRDLSKAHKKAEIAAVLQAIADKNHYSASEFKAICNKNNVTENTVLQYVKHDIDYAVSRIYDFIPWDEVDNSAEMPFTGYGNSGVQVFQGMDGIYICEVVKVYYFPCCYEVSFNYHDIISGSTITQDFPSVKLPMFKKAVKKVVSPENFLEYVQDEIKNDYNDLCYDLGQQINYENFWYECDIDGKMQEYYDDFIDNLTFEIKELPITKENMDCWYNVLDCIAYKELPEFELN